MLTLLLSPSEAGIAQYVGLVVCHGSNEITNNVTFMIQDFQIENPIVPPDCIVQLAISLKKRYSCLRLENTLKPYSTLNAMECERR